jgi:DNA polymerase (family X)
LGHPSGRRLKKRGGYDLDMERVIREAKRRGTFLELNSQPQRLDLNDIHAQMAKNEGVKMSIDSDAHSVEGFANLRFGIGQARRAWLTKDDVLNTRPLGRLRKMVAAIRP